MPTDLHVRLTPTYREIGPLASDDRVTFAHLGNVLIACTHDHETEHSFSLLEWNLRAVAASNGGKVGVLFVVDHSKGPAPLFIERSKEVMDRTQRVLVAVSTVLLPEGFVASVYRSMGAKLLAMLGMRRIVGVHSTLRDGAAWLLDTMPPGPDRPDFEALVNAAQSVLRVQRASAK